MEFIKEQHRVEQEILRLEHGKKGTKPTTRRVAQRESNIAAIFEQYDTLERETFLCRLARNMDIRRREVRGNADDDEEQEDEEDQEQEDEEDQLTRNVEDEDQMTLFFFNKK